VRGRESATCGAWISLKNSGNSGVGDRREKEEEKIFSFSSFFLFFDRTNQNRVMWSVEMVKQREIIAEIIPLQDIETLPSILAGADWKVTLNDIPSY
jgi:hypothetical protein